MEQRANRNGRGTALIPFLIFVAIYLGAGIYLQIRGQSMAFYQFPPVTAMFIAVLAAFCIGKESLQEKFSIFARGAANENVLTMLMIYVLAGAFSSVASAMGGQDATVNLGLSVIPVRFLAAGVFVIAAAMGTATGTSMGTIGAIVPIAVGVAEKGGLSLSLFLGACVGGAMFGDNLSMISDTTIAATRTQGCEMRDKFRVNFLIALPAAVVTLVLLLAFGRPDSAVPIRDLPVDFVKVLPYLAVLVLAIAGMNVFLVLLIGIFSSGAIGLLTGGLTIFGFAQAIWTGFTSMNEVFFLSLFCGGMSELIAHNGGIAWLVEKLRKGMRGNKSAQVGIAALVSLADCATANNTVAIIVSGNVAKDVSWEYRVDPRRTASLLDVFSCVFQGIIPYGAQLLLAASLTTESGITINSVEIIPYMWYCWILAAFGILSIFIPYADHLCRKDPWDWEHGAARSAVAENKIL
ncbi:putative methionine transporter, NhaC family (TC 2.A.35.1.-) [Oscillibacter sp. PC13]|uniref:Na+/H+ antiporter NhaC family protein n=1 Tax=Oscillibacter sp. PC13 TaxID=1855299 RepID=UPI0008E7F1B4|nr:Na+/H+ antiporter NhaC family protein [Oscillibacter sp. PC13]SFP32759.1 putative methionine transporter, NhaC family (TC 2.A.35.1.-) [Oscillibacter sp. PC13]